MDKSRDILLDGYTEDEFKSVYRELQTRGDSLLEYYFRTLIDILLGYYILTYGDNRRSTKILDLFTFKFNSKSPIRYILLIFITRASKQNQYSRLKTIRALYNKKLLVYILSRLAFYLLYYQDLSNKPFPDFSRQLAQYNIGLIKSSSRARAYEAALLYNLKREQIIKAFQYIDVFL